MKLLFRIAVFLCLYHFPLLTRANDPAAASWRESQLEEQAFDPLLVLDPKADPDARWARSVEAGSRREAAVALVDLLRNGPARINRDESIPAIRLRWFGVPINRISSSGFDPDELVNLRYTGTYGIPHQFEETIDWTHDGSDGRTPEWTWQLNRHFHWITLADAYRESGDEKYARAWEKELRSWIAQCPRPEDNGNSRNSAWRTLDTGIRAGSVWPYVFEIFRNSPSVSDEAVWLFFAAQREHALHLQRYPTGGNWKIMESNGLGHVGFMYPEMNDASLFATTAVERMREEMALQFYPDGTHQEFAPHYAAAGCLVNFYALARIAEASGAGMTDAFWTKLANLVNGLARIADPDGFAPPLHDSHKIDIRNIYRDIAMTRDENRYGMPPWKHPVSDLVPFGGYAVFRRQNSYAMFNAGPRGTSHFHNDDLQFLSYAYGRHFGIDSGQPNYTTAPISHHLRSSAAHNVVLMNGELHKPAIEIRRPREPVPLSFHGTGAVQAAAARRTLLQEQSGASFDHERVVLDVDGLGWIILDRLFPPDDEPRTWEWIWNMPVDLTLVSASGATTAFEGGPAMVLKSISNAPGTYTVSSGLTRPYRGWMNSRDLSEYRAIPALRYRTKAQVGPVWAITLHAPFPREDSIIATWLDASQKNDDTWSVAAKRGEDVWRFTFRGTDEIRRIEAWKNDASLTSIRAGGHTMRE